MDDGAIYLPSNRNVLGKTVFPSAESVRTRGRQDLIHYKPGNIKFADRFLSLEEREMIGNKRSYHEVFNEVFNEDYNLNIRTVPNLSYSSPNQTSTPNRRSMGGSSTGPRSPKSAMSPTPSPRHHARFEYSSPSKQIPDRRISNEGRERNLLAEAYETAKTDLKEVKFEIEAERPSPGNNFSFGDQAIRDLEELSNLSLERPPSSNNSSAHINMYSDSVDQEVVGKREQLISQLKVEQRRMSQESGGLTMNRQVSNSSSNGSYLSANRQFQEADRVEEEVDELIRPTKPTNQAGFNRRIQEEFKAMQRRNASETAPVSKARAKFEFEDKVLRRRERVNEESEETLDLERQFSEVEKTALNQEIEDRAIRSAPVFRSLKSPVVEFRERRSQILSEMEKETLDVDPERFFGDIPLYGAQSGLPLPNWRREQLAKKRAETFRQDMESRAQAGIKSELDGYIKMLC